jgi:glutamate racemase
MSDAAIGIIDSGLGGLSVWNSIIRLMPFESTVYIGDQLNLPYSNKSAFFIRRRIISLLKYLSCLNIKIIVIACNTATVAGIDYYRRQFPKLPIVGVVPVIKTAVRDTSSGKIAILSTEFTAKSRYLANLIKKFASHVEVKSIGCPNLVTKIELGYSDQPDFIKELEEILKPVKESKIDVVGLGCTHYPLIRGTFTRILGDNIKILDSGDAVARQVKHILDTNKTISGQSESKFSFFTTGDENIATVVGSDLLRQKIDFKHITI